VKYESISPKQAEIFTFAHEGYDALICDGAVRSGKTSMMMIAFIEWAMNRFNGCNFGICGKTVLSAERNIITPFTGVTSMTRKYKVVYRRSLMMMTVERAGVENYFYVFGGKDESSYTLIQGITLSGVLFDEVALMPRSFVEQGITRTLAEDNAKLWFSCNPETPNHWFYLEWILEAEKHNAKHVHFLMTDNPSLSEKAIQRAAASFSGVFYERYILGLWRKAEGLIYAHFDPVRHVVGDSDIPKAGEYYVSIDYGTSNPFSAGLWLLHNGIGYRVREYYFDSRKEGYQKTDEQYADEIDRLIGDRQRYAIRHVVIDPSAASMRVCLRRRGYSVWEADNDVLPGIMNVSSALQYGRLKIHKNCTDLIREMGLYTWDEKEKEDRPVKENDHAQDDTRYFVRTVLRRDVRAFDGEIPVTDGGNKSIIIGGKRLFADD
jgi:PBSX family phage terminase large subunit